MQPHDSPLADRLNLDNFDRAVARANRVVQQLVGAHVAAASHKQRVVGRANEFLPSIGLNLHARLKRIFERSPNHERIIVVLAKSENLCALEELLDGREFLPYSSD